jgi:hypothetical protein
MKITKIMGAVVAMAVASITVAVGTASADDEGESVGSVAFCAIESEVLAEELADIPWGTLAVGLVASQLNDPMVELTDADLADGAVAAILAVVPPGAEEYFAELFEGTVDPTSLEDHDAMAVITEDWQTFTVTRATIEHESLADFLDSDPSAGLIEQQPDGGVIFPEPEPVEPGEPGEPVEPYDPDPGDEETREAYEVLQCAH